MCYNFYMTNSIQSNLIGSQNPVPPRFGDVLLSGNEKLVIQYLEDYKVDIDKKKIIFDFESPLIIGKKLTGKLIHYFTSRGWREGIKYLLKNGAKIDESLQDLPHLTPIALAIAKEDPQTVKLLIEHNADLHQPLPELLRSVVEKKMQESLENNPNIPKAEIQSVFSKIFQDSIE